MKMIARMFCAAALVLGAFSLTGCGDKDAKKDAPKQGASNVVDQAKTNVTDKK